MKNHTTAGCLMFALLFLLLQDFSFGQNYTQYSTPYPYIRKFNGVGRDSKGNIYIGAGHFTAPNAALFRFNAERDSFQMLGTVDTASISAGNWITGDTPGKIHTNIYEYPDGRIMFATHSSSESVNYANFRGGHMYSYTPQTGRIKDESTNGVVIPNQGVIGMIPAPAVGAIYCIGYPKGDLYRFNMNDGTSTFLFKSGTTAGSVSRCILSDNIGRLYYPWSSRFICYYPDTDSTNYRRGRGLSGVSLIAAHVSSMSGDTLYFINHGDYHIWQYLVVPDSAIDLGPANMDNDTMNVANLALRWDLGSLYYAPANTRRLVEYNITTKTKREVMTIPMNSYTGSNGVDKNGDIWLSGYGEDARVYKFALNTPCAVCSTAIPTDIARKTTPPLAQTEYLSVTPNPMTSFSVIRATIEDKKTAYTLQIIDIQGRMVADLSAHLPRYGNTMAFPIIWNANQKLSGIYFARLENGNKRHIKKIAIIR